MIFRYTLSLFLLTFFTFVILHAQPANDDCGNATVLSNVNDFCSELGAFTNEGATAGFGGNPTCWPAGSETTDVWFSFTAIATDVNVRVIGFTSANTAGGTLQEPQFVIYSGNCNGTLTEIGCSSDNFGNNIAETFAGPLNIGQTYLIRVDARNNNTGNFQLCVNNFNQVPDPSSDCPTGVVLCDKSPFTVESVIGSGNDPNELNTVSCFGGAGEFSSAWYRWTAKDPGTLAFTLTPSNPSDDLDFVVFELPNGLDDCSNKQEIRCMASGENVGASFQDYVRCTGSTGLSLGSSDTQEFPGCQPGDDNFLSAIDMVAGMSYALVVMNFSNTGNGFSIEFDGTGTFQGPDANFTETDNPLCQNETVTFTDASVSLAGIDEWDWSFGAGASPASATGQGPHEVSYSSPGTKFIVLTVLSSAGCLVTRVDSIEVLPVPQVDVMVSPDFCDPDIKSGDIFLTSTGTTGPNLYNFDNSGVFTSDSFLIDVASGNHQVVVMDANGCQQALDIFLPEGLALNSSVNPVTPPTCNGDSDAAISISIEIANLPVTFDFGNGPQTDSVLQNIPAGTYNVSAVDAIGCEGNFTIVVEDPPLLELTLNPENISCFGEQDGRVTAIAKGGAGNFNYIWNTGSTFPQIDGLLEGTYDVTVTDGNGCQQMAEANIIEPPELFLDLANVSDVVCNGESSGVITVQANGGTPPFLYSSNGATFQDSPNLGGLPVGDYTVIVRDGRGCTQQIDATVNEPPPLIVNAGPDQTIDLGFTVDLTAQVSPPFRPVNFQWTPAATIVDSTAQKITAQPFENTTFVVNIVDQTGCTASDAVKVKVKLKRPVYIPNAFSPNGDGRNDFFSVFAGPAARIVRRMKIFSRWGSMVYEANDFPLNDPTFGWDGTFRGRAMDPAVFVYFAEVEFIDGEVVLFKGDVTIVK